MVANVIHKKGDTHRMQQLLIERETQGFKFNYWPAIMHAHPCTGISQAHKQIVEAAQRNERDMVLIMEDDVSFTAPGAFDYFIRNIPADFDLYLGGIYYGELLPGNLVHQFSALHCYIVHQRFYKTFLAAPENDHLDKVLTGLGKFVVCNPMVAKQHPGYSHNVKKKVDYKDRLAGYQFYSGS